ncbi:methyltransferase domain-containing protein [Sphingomonas quercus]|uniref:Methyltransferase domain-containing protein n=1 Tax=Sphingomonas quercus TaxID=2842451 RepID=A0ABS6BHL9_9SPHN|nr:methyltransferase domain-containing protein [Sphingomonas quercus]MBU3077077.1 methyltransferase domain-containing protein [Sphingomonas quercus]
MTYFGNVNPELLRWVPLAAGRVLELGCGEGALAAAYKARNPLGHYTAVEMHGPSADHAETVVDRLLRGDFEAMSDAEITGGEPFDAIVLGDVLEHFRDADAVLARLYRLLGDDGHLVLSVPNVGHWSALYHLINGRWPSDDSGLFDRTHLRFFTLASLEDALVRAGYRTRKVRPRQFLLDRDTAQQWIGPLADVARHMGLDRQAFIQRASTLQYVVVAEKTARPAAPLVHVEIAALAPRLMDVRTRLPAEQLQSVPDLTVGYQESEARLPHLPVDAPKVLVIQRAAPRDPVAWTGTIAHAVRHGWIVVAELDDHPDLMARVHHQPDSPLKWLATAAAHAVQTSTLPLAHAIRAHNHEVAVFPNTAFALPPFPERGAGPARVFYGALNREGFSGPVAASLAAAIAAHPDTEFTVVHDRRFFEMLPTERKRFLPAQPYDAYLEAMAACDIVLMPLEGLEAETFKSDIKYVEAASQGVAAIASPAVYAESIRDGETGLIAQTLADWAPLLTGLLDDPARRRALARAAWEGVRDARMFADQAQARADWYARLWERREELHAALVARLPALPHRFGEG